jgi:hypothetical protein
MSLLFDLKFCSVNLFGCIAVQCDCPVVVWGLQKFYLPGTKLATSGKIVIINAIWILF